MHVLLLLLPAKLIHLLLLPATLKQWIKNAAPKGGALFIGRYATVTLTRQEFRGNQAVEAGGAVASAANKKTKKAGFPIVIQDSLFVNNAAQLPVHSDQRYNFTCTRCTVHCDYDYDYMYCYRVLPAITKTNTTATQLPLSSADVVKSGGMAFGGALDLNRASARLVDCDFQHNKAAVGGG